jgi:uncharacterized protein (DUF433 family)
MATEQTNIYIGDTSQKAIEDLAAKDHRSFNEVLNELVEEAVKMRHCPGIVFADGPTGRRARLAGTGIDVWEVIRDYKACGENFQQLHEALDMLTETQLQQALAYYQLYPKEIDERLEREAAWTEETVRQKYPHLLKAR